MTAQEFKAWFEGYAEGIGSVPSKAQWTRICDQVAKLLSTPPLTASPLSGLSGVSPLLQGIPHNQANSYAGQLGIAKVNQAIQ